MQWSRIVVVIILITLGVRYWETTPPGMSSLQVGGWNDSAAMQVVGAYWGVAHSPGYPLYTILANLFVRLVNLLFSQLEPARLVSLFSAVWAIISLEFFFKIQRRLGIDPWLAAAAVAILGTRPIFWRYAVMAEVYMLNLALILISLQLILSWEQSERELHYLIAIGVLFGAAIAHHRTGIMALFVMLLWIIWIKRKDVYKTFSWRLKIILTAAIPMLFLYAYIPLAASMGAGKTRIYADATQPEIFWFMVLSREWWGLIKVPTSFIAFFQSMIHVLQQQVHEIGSSDILLLSLFGLITGSRQSPLPLYLALAFLGFGTVYKVDDLKSMLIPLTALLVLGLSWCIYSIVYVLQQNMSSKVIRNAMLWFSVAIMFYFPVHALIDPPIDQSTDTVGIDFVEAIKVLAEDGVPLCVISEANTPLAIVQYARARYKLETVEPISANNLANLHIISPKYSNIQIQSILRTKWEKGARSSFQAKFSNSI